MTHDLNQFPAILYHLPTHAVCFVGRNTELEHKDKDLVFINYTFKRFEGLTQRGMLKMTHPSSS